MAQQQVIANPILPCGNFLLTWETITGTAQKYRRDEIKLKQAVQNARRIENVHHGIRSMPPT